MENKLNILFKIQQVEAPAEIYDTLMYQLENRKKNSVPLTWIRSAAAALFVLLVAEVYLVASTSITPSNENSASIEVIVPNDHNTLYND